AIEQLQKIATPEPEVEPACSSMTADEAKERGESFLKCYELDYTNVQPYATGWMWFLAACPFCGNTDKCARLFVSETGWGFKCHHNGCKDTYHWKQFRAHLEKTNGKSFSKAKDLDALDVPDGLHLTQTGNADRLLRDYGQDIRWVKCQ